MPLLLHGCWDNLTKRIVEVLHPSLRVSLIMRLYYCTTGKAGYRVAVCDQLEDPSLQRRGDKRCTEMVTPGTATNDKLLELNSNNFLARYILLRTQFGIAFMDIKQVNSL